MQNSINRKKKPDMQRNIVCRKKLDYLKKLKKLSE